MQKTFTETGAERRQEYIAEIKTNQGSNNKDISEYRNCVRAVNNGCLFHAKNKQMEEIQWQTLKQKVHEITEKLEQERRHTLHAGCFELGVEDVLLIIAEIKLHRIGAVSLCYFCHFLSLFWVQKNCCKMFDFYNSLFQVLFSFGHNYPKQIVAKAAGKVKVFHRKTEEKIKEG